MGFLSRKSLPISHLSKLSPNPTPRSRASPSHRPSPPLPKDLMGSDSSGGSGSAEGEEEEEDESGRDLERILLSLHSDSDEEMEAPPLALGDVGDGWGLDDGGFLELRDLEEDGEFEGEGVEEEEEEELGDGEVVDGDGVLEDFGVLELELMEADEMLVGLEEVVP